MVTILKAMVYPMLVKITHHSKRKSIRSHSIQDPIYKPFLVTLLHHLEGIDSLSDCQSNYTIDISYHIQKLKYLYY